MFSFSSRLNSTVLFLSLASNDCVLEICSVTHLTMNKDTELALRFSTGIKNQGEFFTDLNGFQVIIYE